jgi:hypothetical protein
MIRVATWILYQGSVNPCLVILIYFLYHHSFYSMNEYYQYKENKRV